MEHQPILAVYKARTMAAWAPLAGVAGLLVMSVAASVFVFKFDWRLMLIIVALHIVLTVIALRAALGERSLRLFPGSLEVEDARYPFDDLRLETTHWGYRIKWGNRIIAWLPGSDLGRKFARRVRLCLAHHRLGTPDIESRLATWTGLRGTPGLDISDEEFDEADLYRLLITRGTLRAEMLERERVLFFAPVVRLALAIVAEAVYRGSSGCRLVVDGDRLGVHEDPSGTEVMVLPVNLYEPLQRCLLFALTCDPQHFFRQKGFDLDMTSFEVRPTVDGLEMRWTFGVPSPLEVSKRTPKEMRDIRQAIREARL